VLGELLARFSDESAAAEAVLGLSDLRLLSALRAQADAKGLSLGACVAQAVRRYADHAPDEEWITMMGVLGRAEDPGLAFITRALTRATQATV